MKSATRAWLWRDGAWQPEGALPLTDRAARYGMAVFETIGVSGGLPLLADEHLALFAESTRSLLATEMPPFPLPALAPEDTGMLRIYMTAGDGAPADPVRHARFFALFETHDPAAVPREQTACLHPEPVAPFARGRKTGNYWMNCAAQADAQRNGSDHALLADHEGRILSAAFGNLFFVTAEGLCTPSSSLAVRPGVIRARVLRQQPVREVEFPAAQLAEVSELFLTNSRFGVMPLHFGRIAPGPVGRRLREAILREKLVP